MMLYVREATQYQCKFYNCQVLNDSWFPWTWHFQKNLETWLPIAILIFTASFMMAW